MELLKNRFLFNAKDHLVSEKTFPVYWDEQYQLAYTDTETMDPSINYYESIEYASHKKKRKGVVDFFYRNAQKVMFHLKWKLLNVHSNSQETVLDVGAGVGEFASYLKAKGVPVIGVENNAKAEAFCLEKGLKVYNYISEVPQTNVFKAITLWHVLEHLTDPAGVVSRLHSLLQNDGLLVIAVPNFSSHDAKYYKAHWAALDVPRHLWHFTPKALVDLLEKTGYVLVKTAPMWFDAFYVAYLSEKQKGKKLPLLKGGIKGCYFNVKALFSGQYSSKIYCFKKA